MRLVILHLVLVLVTACAPTLSGSQKRTVDEIASSAASPADAIESLSQEPADQDLMLEALAQRYTTDQRPDDAATVYFALAQRHPETEKGMRYAARGLETASPQVPRDDVPNAIRPGGEDAALNARLDEALLERAEQAMAWGLEVGDTALVDEALTLFDAHHQHFSDSPRAGRSAFFYAELLFHQQFPGRAAEAYERALGSGHLEPDFERAAIQGAVHAGREALNEPPSAACPEVPTPANLEPLEMAPCRQRYVNAAERFLESVEDPSFKPELRFEIARMHYVHNHFDEAEAMLRALIDAYPQDPLAIYAAELILDIYNQQQRFDAMWRVVKQFQRGPLNRPPFDERLNTIGQALDFKRCSELEGRGFGLDEAAECFEIYAEDYPDSEDRTKALWNAFVFWERVGRTDRAFPLVEAVIHLEPKTSELAREALFAYAEGLTRIVTYADAAERYAQFAQRYPTDPRTGDALATAATLYRELGETEPMMQTLELYITQHVDDTRTALEHRSSMGRIAYDHGRYKLAIRLSQQFLDKHPDAPADLRLYAEHSIALALRETGSSQATAQLQRVVDLYATRPVQKLVNREEGRIAERVLHDVAEAAFFLAQNTFDSALAVHLFEPDDPSTHTEKHLQKQLTVKAAAVKLAIEALSPLSDRYPVPRVVIDSVILIGQLHQDMYEQILGSPIPRHLNADQKLIYEDMLTELAKPFREKAQQHFQLAVGKANELGIWTERASEARDRILNNAPLVHVSGAALWLTMEPPPLPLRDTPLPTVIDTLDVEETVGEDALEKLDDVLAQRREGYLDDPQLIERLEDILPEAPDWAMLLFTLGRLYDGEGDPTQAEDFYRRARLADPGHVEAHVQSAVLLARQGKRTEGLELLRELIERHDGGIPTHGDISLAFYNLAVLHMRQASPPKTLESDVLRAFVSRARDPRAFALMARYLARKNDEKRLRVLSHQIENMVNDTGFSIEERAELQTVRVWLYHRWSDTFRLSIERYRLLSLDPERVETLVLVGIAALEHLDPLASRAAFDKVLEVKPKHRIAQLGQALIHLDRGEVEEATAILKRDVKDPRWMLAQALLAERQSDHAKAIEKLEKVLADGELDRYFEPSRKRSIKELLETLRLAQKLR